MNDGEKAYMCLDFAKGIFGVSMFMNNVFIMLRDVLDAAGYERIKALIYKFNITDCICTLNIDLDIFDNLSDTGVSVEIIEGSSKKVKAIIEEDEYAYGNKAMSYLSKYLSDNVDAYVEPLETVVNVTTPVNSGYLVEVGSFGRYKLFVLDENEAMYISYSDIHSLNLLNVRAHPNKFISTKRQEASLFSYINNCETRGGRERLRMWMLSPLLDEEKIAGRKRVVKFMVASGVFDKVRSLLKKCKGVENDIARVGFRRYFKELKDAFTSAQSIKGYISDAYQVEINGHDEIFGVLDFAGEFLIREGYSSELDRLKGIYERIPEYLNDAARRVATECSHPVSVIYYPQIGYLVESEFETEVCDWELKFKIGESFYYKNKETESLDNGIGDIRNRIKDMEIEVLNEFNNAIQGDLESIKDFVYDVDCYNSIAIYSYRWGICKGTTGKRMVIEDIRGIDCNISCRIDVGRNILLTGKNGSGKSTLLRNIAYIVILNQMGSFVPCKKAELPIYDKLFIKGVSKDSTGSFRADLVQVSRILKFSTKNSLVLIDEFGKGTNIIEGVSILLSVLKNLDYTTTIVTTHFQEYFTRKALFSSSLPLPSKTFSPNTGFSSSFDGSKTIEADEMDGRVVDQHFKFLERYKFYYINDQPSHSLREGIYNEKTGVVEYLKKIGFRSDFIAAYERNKDRVKGIKRKAKRDDGWAVKAIQDFILSDK